MTCHTCEDAAWLEGTDTPASIARRLGYGTAGTDSQARQALLSHLRRHGRHDLADRYNRQGATL